MLVLRSEIIQELVERFNLPLDLDPQDLFTLEIAGGLLDHQTDEVPAFLFGFPVESQAQIILGINHIICLVG
jgi:hypothetical protein